MNNSCYYCIARQSESKNITTKSKSQTFEHFETIFQHYFHKGSVFLNSSSLSSAGGEIHELTKLTDAYPTILFEICSKSLRLLAKARRWAHTELITLQR